MDGFDSSTERDRDRRDEPARRARPGAAPAGPLRPPRRRAAARPRPAARRSSRCTRAACRSRPTSTSAGSPRRRRAWSAPTSRTSSTRRRCSRRAASHDAGHGGRLHRRARADRARRRAAGDDERRGPPPHRLPRGRARDRRDAHARAPTRCARSRSSRAAWRSASRSRRPTPTASTTRERELRREDQGRARRPRGGGDRLRRADDRRRVRHPAADGDRAPDGRPLGHERRRSARSRCFPRDGRGPLLPGASEVSPRHAGADRRGGAPDRRRGATSEVVALLREHRGKLDALAEALLEHETLDEDDAYAAAGVPHERRRPAATRGSRRSGRFASLALRTDQVGISSARSGPIRCSGVPRAFSGSRGRSRRYSPKALRIGSRRRRASSRPASHSLNRILRTLGLSLAFEPLRDFVKLVRGHILASTRHERILRGAPERAIIAA